MSNKISFNTYIDFFADSKYTVLTQDHKDFLTKSWGENKDLDIDVIDLLNYFNSKQDYYQSFYIFWSTYTQELEEVVDIIRKEKNFNSIGVDLSFEEVFNLSSPFENIMFSEIDFSNARIKTSLGVFTLEEISALRWLCSLLNSEDKKYLLTYRTQWVNLPLIIKQALIKKFSEVTTLPESIILL